MCSQPTSIVGGSPADVQAIGIDRRHKTGSGMSARLRGWSSPLSRESAIPGRPTRTNFHNRHGGSLPAEAPDMDVLHCRIERQAAGAASRPTCPFAWRSGCSEADGTISSSGDSAADVPSSEATGAAVEALRALQCTW
jgi:hypothetical protein